MTWTEEISALYESLYPPQVDRPQDGRAQADIDPSAFDQRAASLDEAHSLVAPENLPKVRRLPNNALVFDVMEKGELKAFILPIEGYGLWGTLYGYLALAPDARTVVGITFYEHGETPGLGGEVDNPRWKALWPGRLAFNERGKPVIAVKKGVAGPVAEDPYNVDGLSGATITSRGVTNLVRFWLGEDGFGPYLASYRAQAGARSRSGTRTRKTRGSRRMTASVLDPLFNNNPIALQVLGICSALAVTTKMETALVMSLAVIAVTALSNASISLLRNHIPSSIRIIVQLTVIASLVIIADQVLKAFVYDIAQAALGLRRADHHELHRDGPRRGLRDAEPPEALRIDGSAMASATRSC